MSDRFMATVGTAKLKGIKTKADYKGNLKWGKKTGGNLGMANIVGTISIE
ncbi:MAG: hypothetical protein IPL78_13340 [Chloroflexi bacterium]|nr:hypothetical protein [Chloroflexota bacterium]